MGQQRPDDLLLLRHRPRGPARVRRRRAARAPPPGAAGPGRPRRDGRPDRDLPGVQRGRGLGAGVGSGDVDRHRVRARHAGPGRAAIPRPAAWLPADDHRRRRRRRPDGHRRRLQRCGERRAAADRIRPLRPDPRRAGRRGPLRAALLPAGAGRLGGALRVGHRPRGAGARGGADHLGLPGGAHRARAGDGAVPRLPRAADAGIGAHGAIRPAGGRLAERQAAAALPPLDQLRGRAALRAGQHRHRDRRRFPLAGLLVADHARDPLRLRARQAGRHHRGLLAGDEGERRAAPATGRLGRHRRRRDDRRDRLHRLAADRGARLRRHRATGGEARRAERGDSAPRP